MFYKQIRIHINRHPLWKRAEYTLLIVKPHTLKLNWFFYTQKFENFYKTFSFPVYNNPNRNKASTHPTSIYESYELLVTPQLKPDFKLLHLHTFYAKRRTRTHNVSLFEDSFEEDPKYQEILEELILNLPKYSYLNTCLILFTSQMSTHQRIMRGAHRYLQMLNWRSMTSSCWLSTTFSPQSSRCWCWPSPVPETVCEMLTPALFTMAPASPQPQSEDAVNFSRANPLPSSATASSSSGDLPLLMGSNPSSPERATGSLSSSQEPPPPPHNKFLLGQMR